MYMYIAPDNKHFPEHLGMGFLSITGRLKLTLPVCHEDEVQEQRTFPSPVVSLEEREAAYQAARERIFSDSSLFPEDSIEQRGGQRVRPVPIVARRMIAHALGKASPFLTLPTTQEEVIFNYLCPKF